MLRPDLDLRLRVLAASVADRLADDQRRWLAEFLDAGEHGVALEMIADWLSEDGRAISSSEREDAEVLSVAIGNVDRVMGPLRLCPDG